MASWNISVVRRVVPPSLLRFSRLFRKEIVKLKLDLEMFAGKTVTLYKDDKKGEPQLVPLKVKENGKVQLEILPQGGAVLVNK